ncbi:hypothetical protein [Halomonas alkalisoli]|uniref:hypothetical protein n=1 Tax=Halomonas alkalisoli TaxID=2907158 RepID=UPI001F358057|nr:hypothetical protein [Halomonas alkalisoli]MCE9684602.1 hypothetical protein [Halomonas alkalisoli]
MVDVISTTCRYLDQGDCEKFADLLTGRLDPEDVPATAGWVRQCFHRPNDSELFMRAANALLDSHGVELIRGEGIGDGSGDDLEYVNAGDPYVPTLIRQGGSLYLAGQGDMVEAIEQRQLDEQEGRDWNDMPFKNPSPMPQALDAMIEKAAGVEREEATYHRMDDLAM